MARRKIFRNPVSDTERWRISLLAQYGFHYRTIAGRLYNNGNGSKASDSEVARVGRIAREEGVSSMDWRKGESTEAQRLLRRLGRTVETEKAPKMSIK